MSDEKKFNWYKFFGAHDTDYDGDIDEWDYWQCEFERQQLDKLMNPVYERNDDEDEYEDIEDMDDLEYLEYREMMKEAGYEFDDDDDFDDDKDEDEEDDEDYIDDEEGDYEEDGEDYIEDNENCDDVDGEAVLCADEEAKVERRRLVAEAKLDELKRASSLSKEEEELFKRCEFIVENMSLASKYCDVRSGFKMQEAVKDNCNLPQDYLMYNDILAMNKSELFDSLYKYNADWAIKVWVWLLLHFSQYKAYDERGFEWCMRAMLGKIGERKEQDILKVLDFLGSDYAFLTESVGEMSFAFGRQLICEAIKHNRPKLAKDLFKAMLENERVDIAERVKEAGGICRDLCAKYQVAEVEFFRDNLLPMLKANAPQSPEAISELEERIDNKLKGIDCSDGDFDEVEEVEEVIADEEDIEGYVRPSKLSLPTSSLGNEAAKIVSPNIVKRREDAIWKYGDLKEEKKLNANDQETLRICKFIIDGKSLAAKYCDYIYGFRILEAVKDNYDLPADFLDYYDIDDISLGEFFEDLRNYSMTEAIKVWAWGIEQFSKYREYDEDEFEICVDAITGSCHNFEEEDTLEILNFLDKGYGFLTDIIKTMSETTGEDIICSAIKYKRNDLAKDMFKAMLENERVKLSRKEEASGYILAELIRNYEEAEVKFFRDEFIPMLKEFNSPILNKKIARWEKEIAEELDEGEEEEDEETEEEEAKKEDTGSSYESSALRIRNKEILKIHEEQEKVIAEYKECGEYIEVEMDEPKFFDYAFSENASCYSVLCKKILEEYGKFTPLKDGYIVGKMPTDDLHLVYLLVSSNSSLYDYSNWGDSRFPECDAPCRINKPIIEFLIYHVRPVKLMLLDRQGDQANNTEYYYNKIFREARNIWRGSELKVREEAQAMYLDFKEKGLVAHAYVYERELYRVIKDKYPDAKYAYRSKWLGDRLVDVFIPSKQIAVYYNRNVPELVSGDEVEAGDRYIAELRAICAANDIKLVVWRYHDPITKDAVLDNIG